MRRLLVAGIAALAVVLGLVVSTGVASAAPSVSIPCTGVLGATCNPVTPNGHQLPACTITTGTTCSDTLGTHLGVDLGVNVGGTVGGPQIDCTVGHHRVGDHCVPDGAGFPGNGHNGHWIPGGNLPWGGPTLYGHQLWLNAQLGLDICGYGNSYDTFLNRNLSHRSDIDRYLGRGRWQSLYSSDCNSSLAVVPNGLSLINGNLINLSLLGLQGAGTVDVCDYPSYDVFNSRFGSRFGNRWDNVRNRFGSNGFNVYRQLRVNAHCTTIVMPSSTTIVQQPQQTLQAEAPAADPSGSEAAATPAPLASGPLPAIAPAKAPNEGGFDLAYVLAHARVA